MSEFELSLKEVKEEPIIDAEITQEENPLVSKEIIKVENPKNNKPLIIFIVIVLLLISLKFLFKVL
jgi:hypothetical protein